MTAIIDYGMGNTGSIQNMLRRIGATATISSDPEAIAQADRLVLPGVGSFGRAMANLHERGLVEVLNQRVEADGVPILGICLGMQLFADGSEEAPGVAGFGWVPGQASRFSFAGDVAGLRVPHMGWNTVDWAGEHPIGLNADPDARYYFVHTYAVTVEDRAHALATATYGIEFDACIGRDNVVGTQFHPEKSHRYGMALMRRFLDFEPSRVVTP